MSEGRDGAIEAVGGSRPDGKRAIDAVSGIEAGVEAENVLLAEAHGRREEVGEVS